MHNRRTVLTGCFTMVAAALFYVAATFSAAAQDVNLEFAHNLVNTPKGGAVVVNDIAADASGNRYITGKFKDAANFSPQESTPHYLRSRGINDIFVAKYDANGDYVWAFSIGQVNDDEGNTIAVDASGNVYIAGYYNYGSGIDFNPGSGTALLSSTNVGAFFAKYDSNGNYVWANKIDATGEHIVYDLTLDAASNLYISGIFANVTDFDPGAGTANLTPSANNMFFAKYSTNGDYILAKCISGSTSNDIARSIAIDASSNIYLAGGFRGTTDFDPGAGTANLTSVSAGNNDIFFAKYDASGNYVFARQIGNANEQQANGVTVNSAGSIFLTGYIYGTTATDFDPGAGTANLASVNVNEDIFVARYDTSGNYLWAFRIGSTSADRGLAIGLDAASNAYITGFYNGTMDFNPGAGTNNLTSTAYDIFCAKYDASGVYQFAFGMGGSTDAFVEERGICLTLDASANIFVGGKFLGTVDFNPGAGVNNISNPNNTNSDSLSNGFHAKYTSAGVHVNAKSIGGISCFSPNDYWSIHAVDGNGNVFLTGSFTTNIDLDPGVGVTRVEAATYNDHDIFLAKYNSSGNLVWGKRMGSTFSDQGLAMVTDNLGNIYVAGIFEVTVDFDPNAGVSTMTSAGGDDIFLAKYDTDGNLIFARRMGGTSAELPRDLTLDASGNIILTGYFSGTADFDPGAGTANLTSGGGTDLFLAKYDASGNYIWAGRAGGTTSLDEGRSVKTDGGGNIYLAGFFSGSTDFDFGAGTATLTAPTASADMFFAKYATDGTLQWVKHITGTSTERAHAIALDASGNMFLTGEFTGTVDFDPSASVASLTSAGVTTSSIFIAKYGDSGNYLWARRIGSGTAFDAGQTICTDAEGNVFCSGNFGGGGGATAVDFDPGAGTAILTSAGLNDIFFGKYTTDGNYVWAKRIGGTNNDYC